MKQVDKEDRLKIRELINQGQSIEAVKYIMDKFGLRLKDAYSLIKAIKKDKSIKPFPSGPVIHSNPKMNLVLLVFPVIGIIFLVLSSILFINKKNFLNTAIPVTGIVLDRVASQAGWAPVIQYEYGDNDFIYRSDFYSRPGYEINDQVELLIDPVNPADVTPNSFMHIWFLILILSGLGTVFTIIGFIMYFILRSW